MALEESKVLERYFDKIAPNYQFMNKLLSLNLDIIWRERLRSKAQITEGSTVLDIACGTCDVLDTLGSHAEKNKINVKFLGLDLSFGMLQTSKLTHQKFELLRGNGVKIPVKDNSVDLVTISFGYRNMPDHSEFLSESLRVLKPGGQLLILELTQPENRLLRWGNQLYLKTVLPAISSLFGRDRQAYLYLAKSIQAFPSQKTVRKDMENQGFATCSYQLLHSGITTLFEAYKP